MKLRSLLLIAVLGLSSCQTIAPSPILFHRAVEANNESIALYQACSEGANYVPTKEGCDPEKLVEKLEEAFVLSKECIAADPNQPQCYVLTHKNQEMYCRIKDCGAPNE